MFNLVGVYLIVRQLPRLEATPKRIPPARTLVDLHPESALSFGRDSTGLCDNAQSLLWDAACRDLGPEIQAETPSGCGPAQLNRSCAHITIVSQLHEFCNMPPKTDYA
jgi:hypothetical protein